MNVSTSLRNIPPVTRSVVFLVVCFYSLYVVFAPLSQPSTEPVNTDTTLSKSGNVPAAGKRSIFVSLFAVTLDNSLWWIWTYISAGFFESNLFSLLVNVPTFLLCGKYLEHAWGTREFLKFIMLVNVATFLLVGITLFFEYAVTLNEWLLFSVSANGLSGLLFGFLISFKQMVPEHTISLYNVLAVRVKHVPSIAILIYICFFALGFIHAQFYIILYGSLISWIYIRFYKVQDGIRGDRSETFSFISFFPEITHAIIAPISNSTFKLLVKIQLCPPLAGPSILPTTYTDTSKVSTPLGSDTADAERRRALALRALDMRLQAQNQTPTSTVNTTSTSASTTTKSTDETPEDPEKSPTTL